MEKEIVTKTSTFERLRSGERSLYVDKTYFFYKLASSKECFYFCARPHGFGKSLALSAFSAIFSAKKELFDGLAISYEKFDWQVFAVIFVDFSKCDCTNATTLSKTLCTQLLEQGAKYGVGIPVGEVRSTFENLVKKLKNSTKKDVVILVDDYDAPFLKNLFDEEGFLQIARIMESFFLALKSAAQNERFVFVTGTTRFCASDFFSSLNFLSDITMHHDFSQMFGYTKDEVEQNFDSHIEKIAKSKNSQEFLQNLTIMYGGFKFASGENEVFNPCSVNLFFASGGVFKNFWYSSGIPTDLLKLAKKFDFSLEEIEDASVSDDCLALFNIADFAKGVASKESLVEFLFQLGFLTIGRQYDASPTIFYDLCFPNREVRTSFQKIVIEIYSGVKSNFVEVSVRKILSAAQEGDCYKIADIFFKTFSQFPGGLKIRDEKFYKTLVKIFFELCGANPFFSASGERLCASIQNEKNFFIFEVKFSEIPEKSPQQIESKKILQNFLEDENTKVQKIFCITASFCTDRATANFCDWCAEEKKIRSLTELFF